MKCGAKKKQGDGECGRPAGWGTSHPGWGRCKLHGGSAPMGVRSAELARAKAAVVTFGLPVEVDALTALRQEVWRTAGHVAYLEAEIRQLKPEALTWGRTRDVEAGTPGASATTYAAQIPVLVQLYWHEREHLVKVAAEAVRCGLEERIARVTEAQGRLVGEAMQKMFADPELALTAKQRAVLASVVPRHLHAVSGVE